MWRPVGEQHLWTSFLQRVVARVGGQRGCTRNAARGVDHRLVAPPTLTLKGKRARCARAVEQARVIRDGGPLRRFTNIVNARPQELSRVRRIVAKRQPDRAVVAVLRAQYLAGRLLLMRCQDFILTVILSNYIQKISEAVVVI